MNIITKIILTIRRKFLFFIKAFSFRIKGAKAGKKLKIFGRFTVLGPYRNISMGKNCTINHYVLLNAAEKITIGDNVTLSAGCMIHTTQLDITKWPHKTHINFPVTIGNNVWIASGVIIGAGISIGDNVIIGANSYISKSLESGYFYAGSPAIKIKEITHLKEK